MSIIFVKILTLIILVKLHITSIFIQKYLILEIPKNLNKINMKEQPIILDV